MRWDKLEQSLYLFSQVFCINAYLFSVNLLLNSAIEIPFVDSLPYSPNIMDNCPLKFHLWKTLIGFTLGSQ